MYHITPFLIITRTHRYNEIKYYKTQLDVAFITVNDQGFFVFKYYASFIRDKLMYMEKRTYKHRKVPSTI